MKIQPTQTLVKILFDYNPETGMLTWRERDKIWSDLGIITEANRLNFNSIWPKERAGTVENEYRSIMLFNKHYLEHRIIWLWMTGEWPEEVDHINGDKLDNRWINLRNVNHLENMKNKTLSKANTSGCSGVTQRPSGKWRVRINDRGTRVSLGDYDSYLEAVRVRKQAEKDYDYHDNHGRPLTRSI